MDADEWTSYDLRRAFVRGAQWWELQKTGNTMWGVDCKLAEREADRRYSTIDTVEVVDAPGVQYKFEPMSTLPDDATDILCVFEDGRIYRLRKDDYGEWVDEDGDEMIMIRARLWCPTPDVTGLIEDLEVDKDE